MHFIVQERESTHTRQLSTTSLNQKNSEIPKLPMHQQTGMSPASRLLYLVVKYNETSIFSLKIIWHATTSFFCCLNFHQKKISKKWQRLAFPIDSVSYLRTVKFKSERFYNGKNSSRVPSGIGHWDLIFSKQNRGS